MRFMHGCYIGLVYFILRGAAFLEKKASLVSFSNKTDVHGISNCKFQVEFSGVVQVRKTPEYISRQVRQVREVVFLGCFANLAY